MLQTRIITLMLVVFISGCANFNSISRSSSLGFVDGNKQNTAIHLDAQQRVVLSKSNMDKVCAEPSPDAMAAYAAALALGVNIPTQGGGSLAQGGQSSIAAIGLRTQSITLMRDALYRVCEASMNGGLSKVHVATLLGRGLDLTSVVLAVEQLTGAVVASQPILYGSTEAVASSSGSEMLHANQQVLGEAIIYRDTKKTELGEAKTKLEKKTAEVEAQKIIFNEADTKRDNEINASSEKKATSATELEYQTEDTKLKKLKSEQLPLEQDVKSKEELLKQAEGNVAAIEKTRDATLTQMSTNAATKTSSSGGFNNVATGKNLHESTSANIASVATSVQEMILHVLNKDYSVEACLAFLSSEADINKNDVETRKSCFELIRAKTANEYYLTLAKINKGEAKNEAVKATEKMLNKNLLELNKPIKMETTGGGVPLSN